MLALRTRNPTPAIAAGVKGILVLVDGEIRKDSMPMEPDAVRGLVQEVGLLASCYSEGGLPPKSFYSKFLHSSLLILFARRSAVIIWMDHTASISEVEIAGRKLVSTAHLTGSHRTESILLPASSNVPSNGQVKASGSSGATKPANNAAAPSHSTLTKIMSWSEASNALESILTKVLTHAQAARLIERTLTERGVDSKGHFDLIQFREVGSDLLTKIPNRSIRLSLTKEFEALIAKLS